MTTELTRDFLLELYRALPHMYSPGEKQNTYFVYGVKQNIKRLQPIWLDYQKIMAFSPSDEGKAYDKERIAICLEHSEKDKDNNPKMSNNSYVIDSDRQDAFKEAMKELQDGSEKAMEEIKEQNLKIKKWVSEKAHFDVYQIYLEHFPPELTPEQIDLMDCMVRPPKEDE